MNKLEHLFCVWLRVVPIEIHVGTWDRQTGEITGSSTSWSSDWTLFCSAPAKMQNSATQKQRSKSFVVIENRRRPQAARERSLSDRSLMEVYSVVTPGIRLKYLISPPWAAAAVTADCWWAKPHVVQLPVVCRSPACTCPFRLQIACILICSVFPN